MDSLCAACGGFREHLGPSRSNYSKMTLLQWLQVQTSTARPLTLTHVPLTDPAFLEKWLYLLCYISLAISASLTESTHE